MPLTVIYGCMASDSKSLHVIHVIPVSHSGGISTHVQRVTTEMESVESEVISIFRIPSHSTAKFDCKIHEMEASPFPPLYREEIESELFQHFRLRRPEVVHSHHFYSDLFALPAARRAGVPRIFRTTHGIFQSSSENGFSKDRARVDWTHLEIKTAKSLESLCDGTIAVSEALRRKLVGYGLAPASVSVIRNGIPIGEFSERQLQWDGGTASIGYVGRVEAVKNVLMLPQLLADVKQSINAELLLVGDGPQALELAHEVRKLHLGDSVKWLGWRSDINQLLQTLHVLVLPSVCEGCPYILLEAMAAGCPVVASSFDGVNEILTNNETGCIFPLNDSRAAADAVVRIIRDRDFRRAITSNARKQLAEQFDIKRQVSAIRSLYGDTTGLAGPESVY